MSEISHPRTVPFIGVARLLAVLLLATLLAAIPAHAQLLGDLDSDTRPTVLDLTRLIGHINNTNLLPASLLPYGDINEDGVINTNDVTLLQNTILGLTALQNPFSAPVLNAAVIATNGSVITISGVARPNRRILVTGGRFAVFGTANSNGLFSVTVDLRLNQLNNLFVTALSSNFPSGTPQPLRILQDSQPPNLFIDFPTNGQTLYTSNTVIAGRVGDMLSGFMGLNVTVGTSSTSSPASSFPANVNVGIGNNGTYERSLVPLAPGTNDITVTATDVHGNSTFRVIRVFRGQLSGPRLELVFGDMQATNVHRRLAQPIIVRALQANGTPFANKLVTLEVTRSDGRLLPVDPATAANPAALTNDITRTPHGIMSLQLYTDASGEARAWWALGGDAGCGNNRVCAMSAGISNAVYYCATARPAAVHQINIGTGNNQKAETGGFVPEPLRAWVSDRCNGIEGLPITFTIIQGGGRLVGMTSTSSQTNSGTGVEPVPTTSLTVPSTRTGHAEALLQLGPDAGQNIIEASYPGNPNLPATFIAYGVARDPSRPTMLSGLVLDNTSCPLGGAACSVSVGGQMFFTTTDVQGQFHFTNTPAGPAFLTVDGSTATNLLGATIPTNSFPSLEFALILIPNAANSLPSPVLLPRLNLNNQRLYLGTNDLVLTCEGMDGLKMTIKAGSMRKPDGSLVTPENPAFVALNQVHHDSVPMPIPDGASPPFAWTLQPGGATFDPPIQIEYPNMSGLPAGTVAYFLSFNHDTRRFEIIASGHVSDDSATILTDPGAGLTIAGWGCNCPPYSVTGDGDKCDASPPSPFVAAAGSGTGSSFTDKAISAHEFPGDNVLCGKTAYAISVMTNTYCDCDPSNGGKRTLARAKVVVTVTEKCYWSPITDPADIAWVTWHENKHVEFLRDFFDKVVEAAAKVDGMSYPTESACAAAIETQFFATFDLEKARLEARHIAFDAGEHADCAKLRMKYSNPGPLRPATLEPVEPLYDFEEIDVSEEWNVRVNGQSIAVTTPRSFRIRNVSAPDRFGPGGPGTTPDFLGDDLLRLTGVRTSGGVPVYVASGFFQVRQGSTILLGDLTFTDTPPRKPESIRATPDQTTLTQEGQTTPVRVTATFPDGGTEERTLPTAGTTYRISNPLIATISENGVVTARSRGIAFVTAVNEGASAVAQLNVSFGDPLTVLEGFVWRADGSAAVGVTVSVGGFATAVTGADGHFSITNVPTTFGPLTVAAQLVEGVVRFVGTSGPLTPRPGGVTDAGILVLQPLAVSGTPMAAGAAHSVALRPDGSLWAWGNNTQGQLGDGTIVNSRPTPVRIGTASNWIAVAAGDQHTVARKSDGSLWAWGDNSRGQLGDGTTTGRLSPVRVGTANDWAAVATGDLHTFAIKSNGTLWAWGANDTGQLGDGTTTLRPSPVRIGLDADWRAVDGGFRHSAALKTDGSLWTWGFNSQGQLGLGDTTTRTAPTRVGTGTDWAAIAAGTIHTVAIKTNGTLWAWGDNGSGQLGDGSVSDRLIPTPIGADNGWVAITAGDFHTVATKIDGSLWGWGANSVGQVSGGHIGNRLFPIRIGAESTWTAIAAGDNHTLGLQSDGTLRGWGGNTSGQLGNGARDYLTPTALGTDSDWSAITGGNLHTSALKTDRTLWAWGDNGTGQLGSSNLLDQLSPVQTGADSDWSTVAAAADTFALKADGSLWAWGDNISGRLGDGTTTRRSAPVRIGLSNDWSTVAAGDFHTVALRTGGSLWAWGENGASQVGDGTITDRLSPVRIGADTDWLAIAAGNNHTVALKTDRSLWAWGGNAQGQLGDGTLTGRTSPVRIGLANDWAAIVAGNLFTVATKTDGTLWAWGDNLVGQLGDGTTTDRLSPTQIGAVTNWLAIAVGNNHTVALKTDRSLWAWGGNAMGQLGLGDSTNRNSPTRVGTDADWAAIAAGNVHTIGMKTDGRLWTWGNNNQGQLGLWSIVVVVGSPIWGLPR